MAWRELIDYYAGLARDQLRRDGVGRGPVDYYLDPDEPPGRWWGSGCAAVGLDGEVVPRAAAGDAGGPSSRPPAATLGRRFGDRSARGFDATFSAPKSVSVLWALTPTPGCGPRCSPPTTPPSTPRSGGSSGTAR